MRWGSDIFKGASRKGPPRGPPPQPSGLHPPFGAPPPRMPLFPSAAEWNANFTAPPPKIPDTSAPPPIREPEVSQPEVSNTNEEIMFPKGKTAELQSFLETASDKTLIGKLNLLNSNPLGVLVLCTLYHLIWHTFKYGTVED